MAFGERLQEVRRRAGLTQEQFAAELKVSRQAVSKWESCRGYPEIEKILYICNRYQVSLDELFSQEVPREALVQDAPKAPLPEKTLKTSLSAFFANLAPREKWLGIGAVAVTLALALVLGLCLKGGSTDMMTLIWIAAMVIFGVVEAITVGLASIWFVVGSVAGLIAAICGGPIWLQLALFFVVSIVCLAATRPLVKKLLRKDVTATNADRVLGQTARVTESIDNAVPTGAVYVGGMTWTARSESGQPIPRNAQVKIVRMEGVRLFVEPCKSVAILNIKTGGKSYVRQHLCSRRSSHRHSGGAGAHRHRPQHLYRAAVQGLCGGAPGRVPLRVGRGLPSEGPVH